jgi:hypothetical protein
MAEVVPVVRYLIACEDIQTNPATPRKATLTNLISAIRSLQRPSFPLLYRELCVFVQMTECRGAADVRLSIAHADTNELVYPGRVWRASLPPDPLEVAGLPFRIRNVLFTKAGLYWIQFWYNGIVVAQQPIVLR